MNRIYQGKVTNVEIYVPANKEKPWQPFDPDPKQAKAKWQSALLVRSKPGEDGWQHHQLFQDAVNF